MEQIIVKAEEILEEVEKVVVGKRKIVEKVLMSILAKGHILIEDIPGVGKTTLALAFSKAMKLEYHRMQFTPDVLPTDVIGFTILNQHNEFEYKPGAILCNLFLADEINRTSSKTQSALLEVMEEGRVTVDGVTRNLPEPFVVIATQNPIGSIGTQELPESQLDRFMVKLTMGYPSLENEVEIMKGRSGSNPLDDVRGIVSQADIITMQKQVESIFIHDVIYKYIAKLVIETRQHPYIELGVSPRGSLALTGLAKANAFLKGRNFVIPEDIQEVFIDVTGHRILLNSKARIQHMTTDQVITSILTNVSVPQIVR